MKYNISNPTTGQQIVKEINGYTYNLELTAMNSCMPKIIVLSCNN